MNASQAHSSLQQRVGFGAAAAAVAVAAVAASTGTSAAATDAADAALSSGVSADRIYCERASYIYISLFPYVNF